MEESSAQRRLDSISRHLLLQPPQPNHGLQQAVLLSNGKSESEGSVAVVIGGMVLDIHATPSIPSNPRTTTPGKVSYVLGGVARNDAECMSKLGAKPFMISALGLDMAGNLLLEHWKSSGLSMEGILRHQNVETPVVCNMLDVNGEVAAGVASVEALEKFLTPEWIQQFKYSIRSAPVLMIDANLNLSALKASCQLAAESKIPVWFEPVSVAKSRRINSISKYVSFASPNGDELVAMANALSGGNVFSPIERDQCSTETLFHMLKPAVWVLLEKGIKIVVVTVGSDGVFLCSKGGPSFMRTVCKGNKPNVSNAELFNTVTASCPSNAFSNPLDSDKSSFLFAVQFPALPASVVRLTGAGDCLVGGTVASICAGLDVMQSLAVGIAASKAAVEAETNVPCVLNLAAIADDAKLVYSAAKVVFHQSVL
ncbi:pseudouridine kinase-like isoform X2 [Pyrus x bretschneideri]|uniref:pseudouridine kinase-like isoform X2 n=1 Tax=Pyrus x bretschneideri TaxID=225117 RepID=UPI002030D1EA|nr:pseudouridine kinase-like isoform X2 [Pyrus x bretschneideri]